MFTDNPNFYPTPPSLIGRMLGKLKDRPRHILEPSAGKGDIVKAIAERNRYSGGAPDVSCIEIDPVLQATLRGDGRKVIDSDFLAFTGPDKFDAIVANPPFDAGDRHLLKAIDIMYRGEIVFLLNAETLRNPHTSTRQLLVRRLNELCAEVEYIQNAFACAERKTGVEVALVYVKIDRTVDDDIFAGADDVAAPCEETVDDKHELSTGRTVDELVAEYNEMVRVGTEMILHFFRNPKAWRYLTLNGVDKESSLLSSGDKTTLMQDKVNSLLVAARKDFWRRTLDLKAVRDRLTAKKQAEFEHALNDRCNMDFTESNVRQFVLNLIGSYEQTLTDAILDIFDMFTVRHCFGEAVYKEENIHYFNGWKTNKSFKVGKKVVIPIRAGYGGPFQSWGKWNLDYQAESILRDIDLVASYFSGERNYLDMSTALKAAFDADPSAERMSKIESFHFTMTPHKKGTIHLTFNDPDVLRRFNMVACRGKGWLPGGYGEKPYRELSAPERAVVDAFEGEKSYTKNLGRPVFAAASSVPLIAA